MVSFKFKLEDCYYIQVRIGRAGQGLAHLEAGGRVLGPAPSGPRIWYIKVRYTSNNKLGQIIDYASVKCWAVDVAQLVERWLSTPEIRS